MGTLRKVTILCVNEMELVCVSTHECCSWLCGALNTDSSKAAQSSLIHTDKSTVSLFHRLTTSGLNFGPLESIQIKLARVIEVRRPITTTKGEQATTYINRATTILSRG